MSWSRNQRDSEWLKKCAKDVFNDLNLHEFPGGGSTGAEGRKVGGPSYSIGSRGKSDHTDKGMANGGKGACHVSNSPNQVQNHVRGRVGTVKEIWDKGKQKAVKATKPIVRNQHQGLDTRKRHQEDWALVDGPIWQAKKSIADGPGNIQYTMVTSLEESIQAHLNNIEAEFVKAKFRVDLGGKTNIGLSKPNVKEKISEASFQEFRGRE
ncbi:hypothetical protein LWI29_020970 [Acer saccharum]|uniref:Uncharacterized protein n=1 Tax=Acer saccharum TaxID=4024 RepID=A0AA39W1L3_ACESA|nr:hypothetical protein LWI29_020970 [Acer saccharum]